MKIENVKYVLSTGKIFPFKDKQFDRIYMVTVLGEIENIDIYMKEFRRVLKDDGIISISEQAGDPDIIPKEDLKKLFRKYDFHFDKEFGGRRNYTLNFSKGKK